MQPAYVMYSVQSVGKSNDEVKAIQMSLPIWSQTSGILKVDGVFGESTKRAVMEFQTQMNLKVDGVVGKTTGGLLGIWRELEKGFDCSHWNSIVWSEIPTDYSFVNIKATEGATYRDPNFITSAKQAYYVALDVGAYHFTKFENDPYKEACNFISALRDSKCNFTNVYLDLEYRNSNLKAEEILAWALEFLRAVECNVPKTTHVGVYTSSNYLREIGLQYKSKLSAYELWAADWNSQPIVPPWHNWSTWQYTNAGNEAWCSTPLDLNYKVVEK